MDPKKRSNPPSGGREHDDPPVAAATINPTENNLTLDQGDSHTETITVVVPPPPSGSGYANVKLVANGATAPFVVSITPAAGHGPLPPQTQTLTFEVIFKGTVPCRDEPQVLIGSLDVIGTINQTGGAPVPITQLLVSKPVRITVPPCPERFRYVYSVKFVCGEQRDCSCACFSVRPGIYATEINIHNYHDKEVKVDKRVIPLVFAGAAIGREPRSASIKASDGILLRPHTATMDDCCRLAELLFGGEPSSPMPISIGFLEIVSELELAVTAVYTASGLTSDSVSIDVEQLNAKIKRS
jgi:hypothetical protein